MATPYRRSPRLKDYDYIGPLACHLVMVTRARERLFSNADLVGICLDMLIEVSNKFSIEIPAYCFMPDHVHLLVVVPEGVSMQAFVRLFKQRSGYALKNATSKPAWQISYYDHVLRREEALLDVARYIWDNPVKEGFVDDPAAYAFSGPGLYRRVSERLADLKVCSYICKAISRLL